MTNKYFVDVKVTLSPANRQHGQVSMNRPVTSAQWDAIKAILNCREPTQAQQSNEQALATALRGIHGWAIEMLDMAEFKAWPDADRADFMLKMRAAEDLLKNYPRKA